MLLRYRRLLFPTNFSYVSFYAMKYAVAIAQRYGAKLHVLHTVDMAPLLHWACPSYWSWPDVVQQSELCVWERASHRLRHLIEWLTSEGLDVDGELVRGNPAVEIVRVARETAADLIVAGTHGRVGLEHALFGSVVEEVARHAPVPVLTIKHPEREFIEFFHYDTHLARVMFPTDFSPFSLDVLPYAVSLCREFGARLVLFHASEGTAYTIDYLPDGALASFEEDEQRTKERLEALASTRCGTIPVECVQEIGQACDEVVRAVQTHNIDLLVLPTHGRTGVAHLLFGGVARQVLRRARCPVLTVRPEMAPVRNSAQEESGAGAERGSTVGV